jgi:hypothetical protein
VSASVGPFCCAIVVGRNGVTTVRGQETVLIEISELLTTAALAVAEVDVRKYFEEHRLPQPPLPQNFLSLAPCRLLITETQGTGKVNITDLNGAVLYQSEWPLGPTA